MEQGVAQSSVPPLLKQIGKVIVPLVFRSGIFEGESQAAIARKYHSCLTISERYNTLRRWTKLRLG